jgi:hypothetical protein
LSKFCWACQSYGAKPTLLQKSPQTMRLLYGAPAHYCTRAHLSSH